MRGASEVLEKRIHEGEVRNEEWTLADFSWPFSLARSFHFFFFFLNKKLFLFAVGVS